MLVALVAIVCSSVLQLAQPYLMKVAIDDYIAAGNLQGLGRIAVVYLAVLISSFLLEYLQTWTLQMTGQKIMFDMRMQIYRHLQQLDVQYYDRNPVGRLMTRVTTDVDVLNELFTAGVVSVFGDIFLLIGIMTTLAIMDWRLAVVAFTVLPLIALVTQWFRRNVRESYRNVRTWIARINSFLQEHITGMSTVQLFRRERRSLEAFEAVNHGHRDANVESIYYYAVFYPAIEVIGALSTAMIIWFGGRWVLEGTLTLGSFLAFLLYSQRFYRPISDLSEKFNILQSAMASSERIFKLLDTPAVIVSPSVAARFGRAARATTRTHRLRQRVLRLQRDRLRSAGRVVRGQGGGARRDRRRDRRGQVDDHQSAAAVLRRNRRTHSRRRRRHPSRSIFANCGGSSASCCRMCTSSPGRLPRTFASAMRASTIGRCSLAAASVHAAAFIEQLPQGYGTAVAERGATLSVGQKQLLSFARALAFDPRDPACSTRRHRASTPRPSC